MQQSTTLDVERDHMTNIINELGQPIGFVLEKAGCSQVLMTEHAFEHNPNSIVYQARAIGYQRKLLELTIFFRSNLLTCFPTFLKCFQGLPLSKEDTEHLSKISRQLMNEDTEACRKEGGIFIYRNSIFQNPITQVQDGATS